jgi:6-phosphogluconolactonase (cycloisomerase 2 family)
MKKYFSISFIIILLFVTFAGVQKGNTAQSPKYFAYVANSGGDNNISAYSINPSTGVLTEIKGSPFPTNISPAGMIIHPNNKFIYVLNYESDSISVYTINASTGVLSQIKGSPHALTSSFGTIKISPSGKFIYTANLDGYISIYMVNAKTGALTAIKGSPFHIQKNLFGITFDPTGKIALTINNERNSIISYSINDKSGKLTKIKETTIKSGKYPNFITIDPTGKYAFVANYDSENLSVYSINTKKGILTEIKGSPFNVGRLNNLIFTLSGKFAYILRFNIIDVYSFNPSTGRLTAIKDGCYGFSDSNWLTSLTVDPDYKFLYATNSSRDLVPNSFNAIYAFSINPTTGMLTEIMESPFDTGDHPGQIIIVEK